MNSRLIDILTISAGILLFFAGIALSTNMTGVTSMTTGTLTVTGDVTMRGSVGAVPQAAVMMFTGSCPTGWTRQTQYESALIYGSSSYSATPAGASTHTHALSSHTHSAGTIAIDSPDDTHDHYFDTASTDAAGDHDHMQPGSSNSGDPPSPWDMTPGACAGSYVDGSGDHTHSFTIGWSETGYSDHGSVAGASGSTSGQLESATSLPVYVTVVFCKKN